MTPRPAEAADHRRRQTETCWKVCTRCGPDHHAQPHKDDRFRIYRLCEGYPSKNGERCFETSIICEYVARIRDVKPPPPPSPGWSDF